MNISAPRTGYDLAKALFHECGCKNIDALVDFAGGEKDHIRVMDPREAYGYMSLADWRRLHGSEVRNFGTVFAVSL